MRCRENYSRMRQKMRCNRLAYKPRTFTDKLRSHARALARAPMIAPLIALVSTLLASLSWAQ